MHGIAQSTSDTQAFFIAASFWGRNNTRVVVPSFHLLRVATSIDPIRKLRHFGRIQVVEVV